MLPSVAMELSKAYIDQTMYEPLYEYLEPRLTRDVINIVGAYTGYFIYDHWGMVTPYMLTQGDFPVIPDPVHNLSPPAVTLLNRLRLIYESGDAPDIGIFSTETLYTIVLTNLDQYMEQYEVPPELDLSVDKDIMRFEAMVNRYLYEQNRDWLLHEVETMRYNEEVNSSAGDPLPISNLLNGIWFRDNWNLLSDSDLKLIARCYGANIYGFHEDDHDTMIRLIVETQTSLVRELVQAGITINLYGVDVVQSLLHPYEKS